jgi:hypothetical protein
MLSIRLLCLALVSMIMWMGPTDAWTVITRPRIRPIIRVACGGSCLGLAEHRARVGIANYAYAPVLVYHDDHEGRRSIGRIDRPCPVHALDVEQVAISLLMGSAPLPSGTDYPWMTNDYSWNVYVRPDDCAYPEYEAVGNRVNAQYPQLIDQLQHQCGQRMRKCYDHDIVLRSMLYTDYARMRGDTAAGVYRFICTKGSDQVSPINVQYST